MRLGALERERDEVREVCETLLRIPTEMVWARGEHEQRAPETTTCGDRRDDGRAVPGQARQPCGLSADIGVVVDATTLARSAVDGAIGVAVRDERSDLDPTSLAIGPTPDDDRIGLVEPNRRGRSCREKPACLFGNRLEHLLRLCRRGDERRDTTKRGLLLRELNGPARCVGGLDGPTEARLDARLHHITLSRLRSVDDLAEPHQSVRGESDLFGAPDAPVDRRESVGLAVRMREASSRTPAFANSAQRVGGWLTAQWPPPSILNASLRPSLRSNASVNQSRVRESTRSKASTPPSQTGRSPTSEIRRSATSCAWPSSAA